MCPARGEQYRDPYLILKAGFKYAQMPTRSGSSAWAEFKIEQACRQQTAIIAHLYSHQGFNPGIDLLRRYETDTELIQIPVPQQSGYRHESEERRYHEIEEVVAGIYRTKAEEESDDDVEHPGPGQFQTIGIFTLPRIDNITSRLFRD